MITAEQIQKLLSALKNHTLSSVRETQTSKLPIVVYNEYLYPTDPFNKPADSTSVGLKETKKYNRKVAKISNEKKFHLNDKWYAYKYSTDEPEYTFAILKIENIPFISFEGRRNKSSFISSLNSLIWQRYCTPFMLFINNKFVNWNDVEVVYDGEDTYLLIYGGEHTWYTLSKNNVSIHLVILPYNVEYKSLETASHFDMMYEITKSCLQDSLTINNNGRISITVPGINEFYEYRGMVYNVGAWLYSQLRNEYLGLLTDDQLAKLKKFELVRYEYDEAGNIANSFYTKFNAFDRDSYDRDIYNRVCSTTLSELENKTLFRFNSNGILSDDGENIIALADESVEFFTYSSNDPHIYHTESNVDNVLLRENYLTFKNGELFPDCDIIASPLNVTRIDNDDGSKYTVFIFYYKDTQKIITFADQLDYTALKTQSEAGIKYSEATDGELVDNLALSELLIAYAIDYQEMQSDPSRKRYLNEILLSFLDFEHSDEDSYDNNLDNDLNKVIEYNPLLLNDLHHTNITSTVLTGRQMNASMTKALDYENRKGLKISRSRYGCHESYVVIFENGELLPEYWNMVAYPNFFFIPMNRSFANSAQIELMYFNYVDNNEIEFSLVQSMVDKMTTTGAKWRKTSIFDKLIRIEDLKIFSRYPADSLVYRELIEESDDIAFNISYRDDNDDVCLMRPIVDTALNKTDNANKLIAVSKRKFIYERLWPDQKSYRLKIGRRFRYCDNQKQYVVFINGRRINDDAFLVTIPKYNRPFWGMYLYLTKFVGPDDRVELFYLPDQLVNTNINEEIELGTDGYIEAEKDTLEVPYDPRLYLFFINGKKIPPINLTSVDTHTLRVIKDTLSTNVLYINPIYTDTLEAVRQYMASDYDSYYDDFIAHLNKTTIDNLLRVTVKMSNTEVNRIKQNVARIAIINEIVRDFWVTSGYAYNETPFIYDYQMDDYIPIDANSNAIIPALDANQYINIIKNEVHFLYFYHDPIDEWYEIGCIIDGTTLFWEYSQNLYTDLKIYSQLIKISSLGDETEEEIDANDREWKYKNKISNDMTFTITGNTGHQIIQRTSHIRFANGIYYGLIDEDRLQFYNRNSSTIWLNNIMALIPKSGVLSTTADYDEEDPKETARVYKDINNVLYDIGIEYIDMPVDYDIEFRRLMGLIPKSGVLSTTADYDEEDPKETARVYKDINNVLYDIGIESNGTYIDSSADADNKPIDDTDNHDNTNQNDSFDYLSIADLPLMLSALNKIIKPTAELTLNDYIIGNNNYFIFACPSRLAYDENGEFNLEFIMPDPHSDDVIANCRDDKTTPVYTSGNWNIVDHNLLEPLEVMEMQYLGDFVYTNSSGYTEVYCAWKSNGFFTRLFENYGMNIIVRYKHGSDYDDGYSGVVQVDRDLSNELYSIALGDIKEGSTTTVTPEEVERIRSGQ